MIYEKRPGRWKISGSSKVYPTKEAAMAALPQTHYEAKEAFYNSFEEEEVDGSIEEEPDNEQDPEGWELFEGSDSSLP